ncbi:MAG TPA: arginine--tRNA ligase, partial [Candidatus Micrarchaeota archaeon]|nr:arginine--tRNA ligase [Candidatus Micrarchaeota archaeon]
PDSVIKSCTVAGPYLNFTLCDSYVLDLCGKAASGALAGGLFGKGRKALVEFPSVNPNKPWHIGHLRNALLGDSVARLLEFSGYKVEREDYIDDLGLQVAQSLWGVLHLPNKPEGKFDHWLGMQYVDVSRRFEAKEIDEGVRKLLHEIEHGDGPTAKKSREIVEMCVKAQYQTSYSYGIYHDVLVFESDIVRNVFSEGLEKIKSSGAIAQETEGKNKGCLVAKLTGAQFDNMESPDKVLIRSDGTATYTGKDIVFQLWKFGKLASAFKYAEFDAQPNGKTAYKTDSFTGTKAMDFGGADLVINVIGMEQAYPQSVIRQILMKMGFEKESENSMHLSYEHATLPEGRFSGRAGTWVGYSADELLAEGERRAFARITKEFSDEQKEEIAHAVALGAIRFAFL